MKLNKQQVDFYIRSPFHCPLCNSTQVTSDGIESGDGTSAFANVSCGNCNGEWTDEYKLVHVDNVTTKQERDESNE